MTLSGDRVLSTAGSAEDIYLPDFEQGRLFTADAERDIESPLRRRKSAVPLVNFFDYLVAVQRLIAQTANKMVLSLPGAILVGDRPHCNPILIMV